MKASKKEIAQLKALYEERQPFFGELHDHSAVGDGAVAAHFAEEYLHFNN